MRYFSRAALAAAFLAACLTQAQAHATLENTQSQPGKAYKGIVRIGHGCEGTATTTLRVQIPEGLVNVKPTPKAGWTLALVKGPYASPHALYGETLVQGVKEIIWSGGNLPDDFYDEFVFSGVVAKEADPEKPLYVPVIQECEKGRHDWVQIPAPGQDGQALKQPAPVIRLAATEATASAVKLGDLVVTQIWARATPGGAQVGGGYLKLENKGKTADRLVSGTADIASGVEFHEMTTEDGVMHMRALPEGVDIAPGQSITFKPGGFHIMFTGLKQPLKQGESFRATLVFEKAGSVTLDFPVGSVGAKVPDEHAGH